MNNNWILFGLGVLFLIATEVAKVYFIMPFPGSQQADTVELAYWIHQHVGWLRAIGGLITAYGAYRVWTRATKPWNKGVVVALLVGYGIIFYLFNFQFLAEKMFYQPHTTVMAPLARNKIPTNKLVLGIEVNGQARAYPIQLIGYHHQVRDVVAGQPVMITYCTVCRTGRAYRPLVGGHPEQFRLVGMDHFNAMFEDQTTGSWWQQATGEAITGPLKGKVLETIPAEHLTLQEWISSHPRTLVLQPDSAFREKYEAMEPYDKGKSKGPLTRRDSLSWKPKSWVVGVASRNATRAYDWNQLQRQRIINDTLGGQPILVLAAPDSASFGVWNRTVNGRTLAFTNRPDGVSDRETRSVWNRQGLCIDGPLKGQRLAKLMAYQEFWHSWQTFHPTTSQYQ